MTQRSSAAYLRVLSLVMDDPEALDGCSMAELEGAVKTLAGHLNASEYAFLTLIEVLDRRGEAALWGMNTTAEWLAWSCSLSSATARERVRTARALRTNPRIREALRSGKIGYAKARALTRIATPEPEAELVEFALNATADQVDRLVRLYRTGEGRLVENEHAEKVRESRSVTTWYAEDGAFVIYARLPPDVGPIVLAALEAAERELEDGTPVPAGRAPAPRTAPVEDAPQHAQRRPESPREEPPPGSPLDERLPLDDGRAAPVSVSSPSVTPADSATAPPAGSDTLGSDTSRFDVVEPDRAPAPYEPGTPAMDLAPPIGAPPASATQGAADAEGSNPSVAHVHPGRPRRDGPSRPAVATHPGPDAEEPVPGIATPSQGDGHPNGDRGAERVPARERGADAARRACTGSCPAPASAHGCSCGADELGHPTSEAASSAEPWEWDRRPSRRWAGTDLLALEEAFEDALEEYEAAVYDWHEADEETGYRGPHPSTLPDFQWPEGLFSIDEDEHGAALDRLRRGAASGSMPPNAPAGAHDRRAPDLDHELDDTTAASIARASAAEPGTACRRSAPDGAPGGCPVGSGHARASVDDRSGAPAGTMDDAPAGASRAGDAYRVDDGAAATVCQPGPAGGEPPDPDALDGASSTPAGAASRPDGDDLLVLDAPDGAFREGMVERARATRAGAEHRGLVPASDDYPQAAAGESSAMAALAEGDAPAGASPSASATDPSAGTVPDPLDDPEHDAPDDSFRRVDLSRPPATEPVDPNGSAATPPWARRADALVLVADRFLGGCRPERLPPDRHQVVIHVTEDVLARRGDGGLCYVDQGAKDEGGALGADTARRLACDASRFCVHHDRDGNVLDIGRKKRQIPLQLRRALMVRDGGRCVFPGCRRTRHLSGHHIEHWADGGDTKLENLAMLCWSHHAAVHEGGYTMEAGEQGFRFYRPDGRAIPPSNRPERPSSTHLDEVLALHAELAIDPTTSEPGPAWVPTGDWNWCVTGFLEQAHPELRER